MFTFSEEILNENFIFCALQLHVSDYTSIIISDFHIYENPV